ncbi:hypothetical protein ACT3TS_12915 [Specibacter sp. AOP5-B1-6]|uniref:hypothetical protein n=1 Tax=Specibacter sp. AOP5-B1-6 TaxID=3457653 RepID=UPI003FB8EFBF
MKKTLLVFTCIFALVTMTMGVVALQGNQAITSFSIVSLLITLALLTSLLVVSQKEAANK